MCRLGSACTFLFSWRCAGVLTRVRMEPSSQLAQIDGHYARYSLLNHRDTIDHVGACHRPFVVRDDDELGILAESADNVVELVDVGVIEWRINLIEDTERGRL